MRRARLLALALIPLVAGCDIAVGVYFATKKKSSHSTVLASVPPDARFFIWMANLATTGDGDTQEGLLQGNGGDPSTAVWTLVGSGTGTVEITAGLPVGMNTLLVQVTANQQYEIDAVEVLDINGTVVDWATVKSWSAAIVGPNADAFLNPPNGVTVNTAATPTQKSIVFARCLAGSIGGFRLNIWAPGARTSGDVVWSKTLARVGDDVAGGAAVSSTGTVVASFSDTLKNTHFYRLDLDGALLGLTDVESNTNVTGGSPSVAIDNTGGLIYVASLVSPIATSEENFEVKTFSLTNPVPPGATFATSVLLGKERIEAHGITLDANRNLIIAGGEPQLTDGVNHWLRKLNSGGTQIWEILDPVGTDTVDTYWYAVTTDPAGNVYAAGNITGALEDMRIRRVVAAGPPPAPITVTQSTAAADRASAIAADAFGNVYVGGYFTRTGQKNSVILKLDATTLTPVVGGAFPIEYDGPAGTDDEILDLAVDSSGFLYAVGYETVNVPNQGKNIWIRKYDPAGTVIWTRTHHEAGTTTGADRAVSVCIDGAFIVVSGEVTVGGGGVDIHVRKYVR